MICGCERDLLFQEYPNLSRDNVLGSELGEEGELSEQKIIGGDKPIAQFCLSPNSIKGAHIKNTMGKEKPNIKYNTQVASHKPSQVVVAGRSPCTFCMVVYNRTQWGPVYK